MSTMQRTAAGMPGRAPPHIVPYSTPLHPNRVPSTSTPNTTAHARRVPLLRGVCGHAVVCPVLCPVPRPAPPGAATRHDRSLPHAVDARVRCSALHACRFNALLGNSATGINLPLSIVLQQTNSLTGWVMKVRGPSSESAASAGAMRHVPRHDDGAHRQAMSRPRDAWAVKCGASRHMA